MGFFDLFKVKNQIPQSDNVDPLLLALLNQEAITRDMAMSIPAVARNVGIITDLISTIPVKLYRLEEENGEKKIVEVADSRADLLNKDTHDTLTGVEFKKALVEDYLLGKGGYAYINRAKNTIKSIHYVPENCVSIQTSTDKVFKANQYAIDGKAIEPYELLRVIRKTKNGASGVSLVDQIAKAIDAAYQTMVYQLTLVKTGGNKKGFLKSQGQLSEEAMQQLKDAWRNLYETNSSKVIVLNKGIEFQESSATSVEMQLNESIKSLNDQINDIFNYSDDFSKMFKLAIEPILASFEAALNRDFLLEREKKNYFFRFDTKEIKKGSLKERYEAYKIARETGWLTINEIRYEENKPRIEGMDSLVMSLGNIIFDVNTGKFYVPNTSENIDLKKGVADNEQLTENQ